MARLSNSAVDKYNTCPRMYKYHYIDRIRSTKKSSPLLFGIAIDEALNELVVSRDYKKSIDIYEEMMLEWKYDYNVDFLRRDEDPIAVPEEVLEFINAEYEQNELHHQVCWHSLWYKGHEFINAYIEQILPRMGKVIEVQKMINLKNENGDSIIGYQDVIAELDGVITIIDNKTSSSSYAKSKIVGSQQLHLYSFAEKIDSIAYIVMRKDYSAKGIMRPIQVLKHEANPEVTNGVLNLFDETLGKIQSQEFPKTEIKRTCRNHFGKPCMYFEICEMGKSVQQIENLEKLETKKEIK